MSATPPTEAAVRDGLHRAAALISPRDDMVDRVRLGARRRRNRRMGSGLAAMALAVGGGSTAFVTMASTAAPLAPAAVGTRSPAVSSTTLARLTSLADAAAIAQGGVARSAEAVRSTRGAANLTMGGDVVATDPGEAVWAIEVVGKTPFVCNDCSVPEGAKPPHGTVITIVVDATSFATLDSGLGEQVPNLAALGTPVSLPV